MGGYYYLILIIWTTCALVILNSCCSASTAAATTTVIAGLVSGLHTIVTISVNVNMVFNSNLYCSSFATLL